MRPSEEVLVEPFMPVESRNRMVAREPAVCVRLAKVRSMELTFSPARLAKIRFCAPARVSAPMVSVELAPRRLIYQMPLPNMETGAVSLTLLAMFCPRVELF